MSYHAVNTMTPQVGMGRRRRMAGGSFLSSLASIGNKVASGVGAIRNSGIVGLANAAAPFNANAAKVAALAKMGGFGRETSWWPSKAPLSMGRFPQHI